MTHTEAVAIAATIGKRLKDPTELEAFRMAYRALSNPIEAQIEAVRKLRPQSSVTLRKMSPDPTIGSWIASLEWYDGKLHEVAELGDTAPDALKKLREALDRVPTPKTPDDIQYEAEERAGIQGEGK